MPRKSCAVRGTSIGEYPGKVSDSGEKANPISQLRKTVHWHKNGHSEMAKDAGKKD